MSHMASPLRVLTAGALLANLLLMQVAAGQCPMQSAPAQESHDTHASTPAQHHTQAGESLGSADSEPESSPECTMTLGCGSTFLASSEARVLAVGDHAGSRAPFQG